MQQLTPLIAFLGGLISIASPCVLPLLPVIVASSTESGKLRPLAIVLGLAVSFTLMGVLAGAFGELFSQFQYYIYAASIGIVTFMGLYMLFDLHLPFQSQLNFFNKISYKTYSLPTEGVGSGMALGMALGIVWLPCTGPVLATILTWVAAGSNILFGAEMLFIYSLGFALPMLAIAYSTTVSSKLVGNNIRMIWIKRFSGFVLLIVGIYMAFPYIT